MAEGSNLVGVDIGSSSIKVAEIREQRRGGRALVRFGYHPLPSQTIVGAEALLRWTHPELGPVSPVEFIPIAEASGQIVDIGRWVLESTCRQLRAWSAMGLPPFYVAINVSARQLKRDFVRFQGTIEKVGSLANDGLRMFNEFQNARAQGIASSSTSH